MLDTIYPVTMWESERFWLRVCYAIAMGSPDPRTHVGAIIVRDEKVLAWGVNRFANRVSQVKERLDGPEKNLWMQHAEASAVSRFLRTKESVNKVKLFCPWACCCNCAIAIIDSGIKKVIAHKQAMERTSDHWKRQIEVAVEMMKEAGISYSLADGKVGEISSLQNGEVWYP